LAGNDFLSEAVKRIPLLGKISTFASRQQRLPLFSQNDRITPAKSATLEEIKSHGYVLTPGRHVGAEEAEDDDEPFEEKMQRLTAKWRSSLPFA